MSSYRTCAYCGTPCRGATCKECAKLARLDRGLTEGTIRDVSRPRIVFEAIKRRGYRRSSGR